MTSKGPRSSVDLAAISAIGKAAGGLSKPIKGPKKPAKPKEKKEEKPKATSQKASKPKADKPKLDKPKADKPRKETMQDKLYGNAPKPTTKAVDLSFDKPKNFKVTDKRSVK